MKLFKWYEFVVIVLGCAYWGYGHRVLGTEEAIKEFVLMLILVSVWKVIFQKIADNIRTVQ